MIVDVGAKILDAKGSTYVVNSVTHDGFVRHDWNAGLKVNVTCVDGPNLDKTMDVSYNLILVMREAKELFILENDNE